MKQAEWIRELRETFSEVKWQEGEPMSRHTTFRIGGEAELFVSPSLEEAQGILAFCRKRAIPVTILGNGSNVLVGDKGIPGLVLSFGREASEWEWFEIEEAGIRLTGMTVQAGALLSQVANAAAEHGLTGLEFAAGIPGTIGGAMIMNAGAYGGEMKDVVKRVRVLLPDGTTEDWATEEMELSYRSSRMMKEGAIVLSVTLWLALGEKETVKRRMQELREQRIEKQPLEYPSAGSTFKRPEGYFAGKLIMDAGLRGYAVGDAAVSEKHCGFVINKGEATAADVRQLMKEVSEKVEAEFGVRLEPEVRFLGEF